MDVRTTSAPDADPLPILIAAFLDHLTAARYAPGRLAARLLVETFGRRMRDRQVAGADLRESHVRAFVAERARGREPQRRERATVHRFVAFLLRRGILSAASPTSPVDALVDAYVAYLRIARGLADNSICHLRAHADERSWRIASRRSVRGRWTRSTGRRSGPFFWSGSPDGRQNRPGSRASACSFLRFLVVRGVITRDVPGAVPRVRTYQHTRVPVVLSPILVAVALYVRG